MCERVLEETCEEIEVLSKKEARLRVKHNDGSLELVTDLRGETSALSKVLDATAATAAAGSEIRGRLVLVATAVVAGSKTRGRLGRTRSSGADCANRFAFEVPAHPSDNLAILSIFAMCLAKHGVSSGS